MEIDINDVDFDALRRDLIDYFGCATLIEPFAMSDVINVEGASDIELLNIINSTNLNINDYIHNNRSNKL